MAGKRNEENVVCSYSVVRTFPMTVTSALMRNLPVLIDVVIVLFGVHDPTRVNKGHIDSFVVF